MIRTIIIVVFVVMVPLSLTNAQDDILGKILDTVGFDRDDLGYQPKGYWSRFPLDVPYKLSSFDDLFAEPLKLYGYSKTMANAAEIYLEPAYLDSNSDALYKLTYALCVDRKLGGFRPYSPNLLEVTDSLNPIVSALTELVEYSKTDSILNSYRDIYDWRSILELGQELDNQLSKSAPKSHMLMGKIVKNLTDIIQWRNRALRNCSIANIENLHHQLSDIEVFFNGDNYYPIIEDISSKIDISSMHYASLKATALVELIVDSLDIYWFDEEVADLDIVTPYGSITVSTRYSDENPGIPDMRNLLAVYRGNPVDITIQNQYGVGVDNPLSIIIDLKSNTTYMGEKGALDFGTGCLNIGILYDASGDDQYIGKSFTQGAGLFGVGILFDKEGDDIYSAELMAQGAGYFGIGMLIDAAGNDSFYVYGSGQGFGGHGGGVGVLVDYNGDDKYVGEPSPEVYDLADYHSDKKINGNFVQGVGYGRRADLTDGHSYAGGLGALIDISGNDHYLSGNWSLGTAYWFSTGIAYDGSGDDIYESCYFTQGSGAHFCNGILIDEGGNDKHELYETAGAGLGFGWDFTNAFLINIGGDDSYLAKMISIGCAEVRSNAFLIDIGGDDKYSLKEGALGLGAVDFRDIYSKPSKLHTYFYEAKSFGGFIDIGGNDSYLSFNDSTDTAHPTAQNNSIWFAPSQADSTYGFDNYGVGIDIEEGIIPEIEIWQKK